MTFAGRCISRGKLILVLADRVDLRVPVASSAASEVAWRSVRSGVVARVVWDYQRRLLLTSGWWVPGAHYLALVMGLYGLRYA